jgi:hypothetical protein
MLPVFAEAKNRLSAGKPQRAVLCREEKIILIFFEGASRQLKLF